MWQPIESINCLYERLLSKSERKNPKLKWDSLLEIRREQSTDGLYLWFASTSQTHNRLHSIHNQNTVFTPFIAFDLIWFDLQIFLIIFFKSIDLMFFRRLIQNDIRVKTNSEIKANQTKVRPEWLTATLRQLRRHRLILTLPPVLFTLIYLDYSHTQKWKRSQLSETNWRQLKRTEEKRCQSSSIIRNQTFLRRIGREWPQLW